jgi:8-oxo-dGTP pyrophosphatase MutT (NUDIX family)
MSRAEVIDRAWRGAYWLGYRLARLWWRVRRPDHHGAMVAVWLDGRILGVRQSYSNRVTWPGGGIHPGEDATHAARRELQEELGLSVRAEDLTLVGRVTAEYDFRQDHVRIFELHLTAPPVLTPDNREIVRACFMRPRDMLAATTPPFIRAYLLERAAP